jgi:adenylate kinase family enzyme
MTALLEPLPSIDLITILCDAFGELLISSSALYALEDNEYVVRHNHGFVEKVEKVVKTDKNSSIITFAFPTNINKNHLYPEMLKMNQLYKSLYAIPIQIEDEIEYFILMGRNEEYSDSEKVIINSLSHLASKIINYQSLRAISRVENVELNRSVFRLEAFYKGLEYLFSIQNVDQFSDNLEDMLKEIFQTQKLSLFVRKSWGNLLWGHRIPDFKQALTIKYNTVWDEYDMKLPNEREAIEDDFGNLKPYLKDLDSKGELPDFASIIRGLDGNILGVIFLNNFSVRDRKFLCMVSGMAGLVLEILLAHKDFNTVLHSYEEVMEAFQSANKLYQKIEECSGVVEFYNIMKEGVTKHFGIDNMFIAFRSGEKLMSFPTTLESDIEAYFKEYFDENYSDIGIHERENGELLIILPIPVRSKQVIIAFDGKDSPKLNVLLQLMQLGFQDKLASILEDKD